MYGSVHGSIAEGKDDYKLTDLIFLPFHPVFKLIILVVAITKAAMGPIQSIYPVDLCQLNVDLNSLAVYVKFFYTYCCDILYMIDTLLHMAHRQVTDEAVKREFPPKNFSLLALDLFAMLPLFSLFYPTEECPSVKFIPNILAFTEFVVVYRVIEYFSVATTHSPLNIFLGSALLFALFGNCVSCLIVLMTYDGLCHSCKNGVYDWRIYVSQKINHTDEKLGIYIQATSYTLSLLTNKMCDIQKPNTLFGLVIVLLLVYCGYALIQMFIPKIFSEGILQQRRLYLFHKRAARVIEETKRRNPNPKAYKIVERFYSMSWMKREGVSAMPRVIDNYPKYFITDLAMDLFWPIYYHSPSLRNTSEVYRRWLSLRINQNFKLPNEMLLSETRNKSHLYFVKSGILQFASLDDDALPLLSVRDGSLIGDISFYVPPYKRARIVRCFNDCELFIVSRKDILQSLYMFPNDRENIIALAKSKLQHAKELYQCKKTSLNLERSEKEGVGWIKKRWWEILKSFKLWKKSPLKDEYELPAEESVYHCSKYLGQLVLCPEGQLQKKSIFESLTFPWIIGSRSPARKAWYAIMVGWVYLVLIFYPPLLTSRELPEAFKFFEHCTNLMFVLDVIMNLVTQPDSRVHGTQISFTDVMFQRFKSLRFLLDICSLSWVDQCTLVIGKPEWHKISKFNRLFKLHLIIFDGNMYEWRRASKPTSLGLFKIILIQFCAMYVGSCFCFCLFGLIPKLSLKFFFGDYCLEGVTNRQICKDVPHSVTIIIGWLFNLFRLEYAPMNNTDLAAALVVNSLIHIFFLVLRGKYLAILYLRQSESFIYRNLVSTLHRYYIENRVIPTLMERLHLYLACNWKYNKGQNLVNPTLLSQEPRDIIKKHQCEAAENVIANSKAFAGANPMLIKDLGRKAKFMLMPKDSVMFLFGVKCATVTWIINGQADCEYHSLNGDLIHSSHPSAEVMSVNSVFFGRKGMKSYIAATDCEIVYININDFYATIKKYRQEWASLKTVINEMKPKFKEEYDYYFNTHKQFIKKRRAELFHGHKSSQPDFNEIEEEYNKFSILAHKILIILKEYRTYPESTFIRRWMIVRVVFLSIHVVASFLSLGFSGSWYRASMLVSDICDYATYLDVIIKLGLPYYDERGVIITHMQSCMWHYLTRGFLTDVIAYIYWEPALNLILENGGNIGAVCGPVTEFGILYLVIGIFNYHADLPHSNVACLMILKWHLFIFLLCGLSAKIFLKQCVKVHRDPATYQVKSFQLLPTCWLPYYYTVFENLTSEQFDFIHGQSAVLTQCALMLRNLGKFHFDEMISIFFLVLGSAYWLMKNYLQTLFVLNVRSSAGYRRAVNQLSDFLKSERVDKDIEKAADAHFNYCWLRTKDINIHSILQDQVGVVFREEVCYFFYRNTFEMLDTILDGGEEIQKHLATSVTKLLYFLPREDIMREMDLTPWVYIVHRGTVDIYKDEKKLTRLSKGAIFGQLDGARPRPAKCTARTEKEHADVLKISAKDFHETINSHILRNIKSAPTFHKDYIASLKIGFVENPYDSIQYILRGRKTIKIPFMKNPITFENIWFSRWLYIALLFEPVIAAFTVTYMMTYPKATLGMELILLLTDMVHFLHIISDINELILTVSGDQCVRVYKGWNKLTEWELYVDIVSLIVPIFSYARGQYKYHLSRLLRLHLLNKFHHQFCKNHEATFRPMLLKLAIVSLILHFLTCGWILSACRPDKGSPFPFPIPDSLPEHINKSIDNTEWAYVKDKLGGCVRVTSSFHFNNKKTLGYIVPRHIENDYLIALTFMSLLFTRTNLNLVLPMTPNQVYYKVFVTAILMFIELWVSSMILSAVFTKYFDLLMYDYHVEELIIFLRQSGLSKDLLLGVSRYSKWAWLSQRGCWLPEITKEAHICLQEDILGALYGHHLEAPPIFRENMPDYFLRQLVVRLNRIVAFPGKEIVREGDIFPCMYFIHEGEIEKWRCDSRGDSRLCGLLSQKSYFGIIPGLFPTSPHKYSYISRTVADLITLRQDAWVDLLAGYPEVKKKLYAAAEKLRDTEK